MRTSAAVLAAVLALAACSRREGSPLQERGKISREKSAPPFYSDLGAAEIDVAGYPARQQENYRAFIAVCGSCHTAARALNSPHIDAAAWKSYLRRMRAKMSGRGIILTAQDDEKIVAFLVYDAKLRKADKREEFQAKQKALKELFDSMPKADSAQ